jgi:hypothetical protein
VTADELVNADRASEVGVQILQNIIGNTVEQHTFRKKEQLIPLSNSNAVKIKEDVINIDSQLLFQRLITAGTRNDNLV